MGRPMLEPSSMSPPEAADVGIPHQRAKDVDAFRVSLAPAAQSASSPRRPAFVSPPAQHLARRIAGPCCHRPGLPLGWPGAVASPSVLRFASRAFSCHPYLEARVSGRPQSPASAWRAGVSKSAGRRPLLILLSRPAPPRRSANPIRRPSSMPAPRGIYREKRIVEHPLSSPTPPNEGYDSFFFRSPLSPYYLF